MSPPTRAEHGRWSWSIGSIAGIELRMHATFLVLLGWVVVSHVLAGHGVAAALAGLALVCAVFAIVVLHELGHALVARRFGIGTRDITLLPIGGIARLERMPTDPKQEFLVAIAGPAVNALLALLAFVAIVAVDAPWSPAALSVTGGHLLSTLLWLNVGIGVFNLLPAFPMDGGRVLRALLTMRIGRLRATDTAARIGQWMAAALGLVGVLGNPMLVIIALFVWIGAGAEARAAHMTAALESVSVADAMVTSFDTLPAEATIAHGVERIVRTTQREFPVYDHAQLLGFVGATELVGAAERGDELATIGSITRAVGEVTGPGDLVSGALERLEASGARVLGVFDAHHLVGLLLPANVAALVQVREGRVAHSHS